MCINSLKIKHIRDMDSAQRYKEESTTLESHEKYPSLIEMAGSPGSPGGFDERILSSARNNSSSRISDTFTFTTFKSRVRKIKFE